MGKTSHGLYSSQLTRHHKYSAPIRREVEYLQMQFITDVSPSGKADDLTAAQVVIIGRTLSIYAITRTLEDYISREGVFFAPGRIQPVLEKYLSFNNTLRLNLERLGIRKEPKDFLDAGSWDVEPDKGEKP